MFIIINGNFGNFEFVGTFESSEAAETYGNENLSETTWYVAGLIAP